MRAAPRQVSRCWHPDARGEYAEMPDGSKFAVLVGDAAYQFTDGEIITL